MLKSETLSRKKQLRISNPFSKLFKILPRELESHPEHNGIEADEYNKMVKVHHWILNRPFIQMVAKLDSYNQRVLDIGTGPGWNSIGIAKRNPTWKITAIDISADMLAIARKNAHAEGVADQIEFIKADATNLPFQKNTFGLVVSHFMLHHIDHPEEMISEANRVKHQNGQLFIKDLMRQPNWKKQLLLLFSKHVMRYSQEQMREYRESIGAGLLISELKENLTKLSLNFEKIKVFRGLDFILNVTKEGGSR